ncbi:hypothetical protein JCM19992_26220 [Thermostilla marina]
MSDAKTPSCECQAAPKLIFACSGAADVGRLADLAARQMTAKGIGKMFCLAGVGGRVSGIMESTKAAQAILAIDGCDLECVRHCLEEAGFTKFEHIRLDTMGFKKGETKVTGEAVDRVVEEGRKLLENA